ncbi:MAG TPA: hypothetical protein VLC98_10920 [Phnomibacter sp.]|nr:hypothetical protein [Phnomibacter sp.]
MGRWYVKAGIIILCLVGAEKLLGYACKQMVAHQKSGEYFLLYNRVIKSQPELVFVGSSRCAGHYNSDSLSRWMRKPVINDGAQGIGLAYYNGILAMLIENNPKLKTVVLDLRPIELSLPPEAGELQRLYTLLPYSGQLREYIERESPNEKYKLALSSLYPFNGKIIELIKGMKSGKKDQNVTGFTPYIRHENMLPEYNVPTEGNLLSSNFRLLDQFVATCKKHNVKLMIAVSPFYGNVKQTKTLPFLKKYCQQNNIEFHDYSSDISFLSKQNLFFDFNHLNGSGANLYTKKFYEEVLSLESAKR